MPWEEITKTKYLLVWKMLLLLNATTISVVVGVLFAKVGEVYEKYF